MYAILDFTFATDLEIGRTLGSRLKQNRLIKGMQQDEVALRAGIARATLQKLENQGAGTLITLIQVVRVLGLEAELQTLFEPQEPQSIAEMEAQAVRRRVRAPNRPRKVLK